MSQHVNIENDELTIPWYAVHDEGKIFGFFGSFSFLSNFYILESGIFVNEMYYPSVENAYQSYKYPQGQRTQFINISPGQAKKLGKIAPNFNSKKWDKNKVPLMAALCRQKFTNDPKLREMLLMTVDCQLEERNSWKDIFWGCNENGEGENHLGHILMNIRHDLITQKEMF